MSLTFLEAWRIRESLHPDGEGLRPWLLGITTNVLRNRRRAARRHREALRRLPVRDTVPDFADEVVARMHDADRVTAATAALQSLRRADREVFPGAPALPAMRRQALRHHLDPPQRAR